MPQDLFAAIAETARVELYKTLLRIDNGARMLVNGGLHEFTPEPSDVLIDERHLLLRRYRRPEGVGVAHPVPVLIIPPLIAIGTYAFLYAWNEYLYALLLLTGEQHIPLPVAMSNFLTTDNAPWNLLMAVSTVYSIPPVVLYYAFKRYLVSGLVTGAVSGM